MGWGLSSWWRKPALKVRDPENSSARRGDTFAGRAVGPDGAMQLATFWSGVRLNAETVSTLPLGFYERLANGSKKAKSDHDLYDLLHDSPNADQTAAEFWEGQVVSLCIHGDGFALKEFSGSRLVALTPLPSDPAEMTVRRIEDGSIRYRFTDRGKREDLPEDKVFHIRGFGSSGLRGLSVVSYARQTLAMAEAAEASAGSTFRNGMKPTVFFVAPPGAKFDKDNRKDFKKAYIDPYVSADSEAQAGLLEFGVEPKVVSIPPRDAELLLTRKFEVEEICRWLRVPPILIGHAGEGQTMWGSGIEQIMLGWLTLGLRPYLTRIEQAIKKRLIVPRERKRYFAEFNVEGLLRADSAGRAALLSSLGQNGYLTRNEGRALDNREPLPGGDQLTVQSNLVPLEMLGKMPPAKVQPAPGEPIP